MKEITLPLTKEQVKELHAGDSVTISGYIYTARDCAHKRLCEMIAKGEQLPFDIKDAIIYYAGPCPAKPGSTVITRIMSTIGRNGSTASAGVFGLMTTPAFLPSPLAISIALRIFS